MWLVQILTCCLLIQPCTQDVILSCVITGMVTEEVCQVTINDGDCRSTSLDKNNVTVHDVVDSKPDLFDVDTFSINGQPGINISISPPKDADQVSGFEISVMYAEERRCVIFNLSAPVELTSTQQMTVVGKIYPLTASETFTLRAYTSSMLFGAEAQECYVRTAPILKSNSDLFRSLSANWMPSIVYYNDSATHTVWLRISPPPPEFKFESFTVELKTDDTQQPVASNITNSHNYTFFNVKPGTYYLAVYPHDPNHNVEGRCLCVDEYGCLSCVRTLTPSFTIFESSGDGGTVSAEMSTGSITRSSDKLTDSSLNDFQGPMDEFSIASTESGAHFQTNDQSLTYTQSYAMSQNIEQSTSHVEIVAMDADDTLSFKIITPVCVVVVVTLVVILLICRTKRYKCMCAKTIDSNYTDEKSGNLAKIKGNFVLVDGKNPLDTMSDDQNHEVNGGQISPAVKSRTLVDTDRSDAQERYLQILGGWEMLKDKPTVLQSGNFVIDSDAYSILNPSIEPARTIMEINLEDGMVTNTIGQRMIPYTYHIEQDELKKQSCLKDDIPSDIIDIHPCPGSVHFISPDVSDCDDVTSQLQSVEMGEINKRYLAAVEGCHKLNKSSSNTPESVLLCVNNSTEDERKIVEEFTANTNHCIFNNKPQVGDSATDCETVLDSGFCSVSKHSYDNISYGGVSF